MTLYDNNKDAFWAMPTFDSKTQERKHLYNKLVNYMKTDPIPELPTREEELKYMKFLEDSFSKDSFLTIHPRKNMAAPYRLEFKNRVMYRNEYRKTFLKNLIACAILASPLTFYLANRRRYTRTGVPITMVLPTNWFNPHYKLDPYMKNFYTRRTFFYGLFKYSLAFGIVGAFLTTDRSYLSDDFHARPDLNHMRIMTPVPDQERKVFEMFGNNYFGRHFDDQSISWVKKFKDYFYPSVHYNPNNAYYLPFYNYKNSYNSDEVTKFLTD